MGFMQRGLAASPPNPTTPTSQSDERSAKRPKRRATQDEQSSIAPIIDHAAVQAALEQEEQKRKAAIKMRAAELGDSHWVLDDPVPHSNVTQALQTPLDVVQVGFADIDTRSSNHDSEVTQQIPATTFIRRFNMKTKKSTTKASRTTYVTARMRTY